MKTQNMLIVGVGGQGAVLVSNIMTTGLTQAGFDVKQSEVHGMAQRGGSVSTQVRWGEKVHGPVFGKGEADYLIAFEEMEAARYLEYLRPDGHAIVNRYVINPVGVAVGQAEYPSDCLEIVQGAVDTTVIDAGQIAIDLGNPKCMNVVLFGALCDRLGLSDRVDWEAVIVETVPPKAKDLNIQAFRAGLAAARSGGAQVGVPP